MTRRGFVQALGLAIAGAIIPWPKAAPQIFIDDGTGFAGHVWTTSDENGNGHWAMPSATTFDRRDHMHWVTCPKTGQLVNAFNENEYYVRS